MTYWNVFPEYVQWGWNNIQLFQGMLAGGGLWQGPCCRQCRQVGVGRLICNIAGWPRCCCATVAVWHCILLYALHHSTDYGCLRLFISFGNCMNGRSAKEVSPLFEAYLCATRKWVLARDSFQLHEQHVSLHVLDFVGPRWRILLHSIISYM